MNKRLIIDRPKLCIVCSSKYEVKKCYLVTFCSLNNFHFVWNCPTSILSLKDLRLIEFLNPSPNAMTLEQPCISFLNDVAYKKWSSPPPPLHLIVLIFMNKPMAVLEGHILYYSLFNLSTIIKEARCPTIVKLIRVP